MEAEEKMQDQVWSALKSENMQDCTDKKPVVDAVKGCTLGGDGVYPPHQSKID